MHDLEEFTSLFNETIEGRPSLNEIDIPARIAHYFYYLILENQRTNLTGYRTMDDCIDFHLFDTFRILEAISPAKESVVTDVGTGAGVPGVLFSLFRPDLSVCLIEKNAKKAKFLSFVKEKCDLRNICIINDRAEEAARNKQWREKSDVVVARALGSLTVSLELTAGETIDERGSRARTFGCRLKSIKQYCIPRRENPYQMAVFEKIEPIQEKYPRKPGHIRKRPV